MQLGFTFRAAQMAAARRTGLAAPLGFAPVLLDNAPRGQAATIGNAIGDVTGGRRPHRVADVAPGGALALQAGPLVFEVAADAPATTAGLAFNPIIGGTLPYQVTDVVTAQN